MRAFMHCFRNQIVYNLHNTNVVRVTPEPIPAAKPIRAACTKCGKRATPPQMKPHWTTPYSASYPDIKEFLPLEGDPRGKQITAIIDKLEWDPLNPFQSAIDVIVCYLMVKGEQARLVRSLLSTLVITLGVDL